ncbi:hypothetical protein ACSHT0_00535 [Tepidicaulis sp. LMO-SS28]|uniref:hypothetical protein n=1 Tax=Tepidicaulis sp. LMO-SS28 TaxID=3447455 RepID=UPI003EE2C376
MRSTFWNIAAVAAIALTAAGFEFGFIAARDAFFIAFAVLAVYTGGQLVARENQPLGEAVSSMFTRPRSHGARFNYLAFMGSGVVGMLVVAHTLTYL